MKKYIAILLLLLSGTFYFAKANNNKDILFCVLSNPGMQDNLTTQEVDSNRLSVTNPVFPDSILISRIKTINSVIELPYNKHVKKFIEFYTLKRRSQVERMLALQNLYFPEIEQVFDLYNIPLELKYLSIIESALNPKAVSRAGATGIWQFMYYTGRMYGLEVNHYVDERMDPTKSTHAAAKFLNNLYARYGDWTLVIAAYNCGPGNVNRAIQRAGGVKDFWKIYPYLPRETRSYVPAFIAATYVMNFHQNHNIQAADTLNGTSFDTVWVKRNVSLQELSNQLDISVDLLKALNPQYKKNYIPGKRKAYSLKIPKEHILKYIELERSIYSEPERNEITYKQNASEKATVKMFYTVRRGDGLSFIAQWYDVNLSDLKKWNNLNTNIIYPGQKLNVYVPVNKAKKYSAVNTMSFSQKQRL